MFIFIAQSLRTFAACRWMARTRSVLLFAVLHGCLLPNHFLLVQISHLQEELLQLAAALSGQTAAPELRTEAEGAAYVREAMRRFLGRDQSTNA